MNDISKSNPPDTPEQPDAVVDVVATVKNSTHATKNAKKTSRTQLGGSLRLNYIALSGLALLLIMQWWSATNQINQLREELARRLHASDASTLETKSLTKSILETNKELQVKFGVLELKQAESESHALALQQLYQDLSKNRDDWALSEIEQVLSTASQQLQLAGNVQGALIALQNADTRLARSDKPQFISIRRAIAHDIDRLKALPNLDLSGIALRLDSAIAQVEDMPLLIDERPVNPSPTSPFVTETSKSNSLKKTSGKTNTINSEVTQKSESAEWIKWVNEHWQNWSAAMRKEMYQLIRIRDVENPDALLLTPSQAYFIKEKVKLRLLNARLALLGRNETVFKNDLIAAQKDIAHYFDTKAKQTKAVQTLLRQIQNRDVSIEMPILAESLDAVRNFTSKSQ